MRHSCVRRITISLRPFNIHSLLGLALMLTLVLLALPVNAGAQPAQFSYAQITLNGNGGSHVAVDGSGNLFVVYTGQNAVKEILAAGDYTTTVTPALGGSYVFKSPEGVAVDGSGNLFVADTGNSAVVEFTKASGYTSVTVLGNGFNFSHPEGVAVDLGGNVYVADTGNSAVEKIPAGGYTTVTPTPLASGLSSPYGVAVDVNSNVYVAEEGNSTVIEISAQNGTISPLGGGFKNPQGIAAVGGGVVFVGDTGNNAVKKIPPGCVSSSCVVTMGSGLLTPMGVAVDQNRNLFVADNGSKLLVELEANAVNFGTALIGQTSTTIPLTFTFTSAGTITSVPLATQGVATGGFLDFAVASTGTTCTAGSNWVAGQTCTLNMTFTPTLAGLRSGLVELYFGAQNVSPAYMYGIGSGPQVAFGDFATLATGNGYQLTSYAGTGTAGFTDVPEPATEALVDDPTGIAVDGAGNIFFADSNNEVIRKVTASTGILSIYAGTGTAGYNGDSIQATQANLSLLAGGSGAPGASGVALDAGGNLYIADTLNSRIRRVPRAGGTITTAAGGGSGCAGATDLLGDGCAATAAELGRPFGIALDGAGNLYIADWANGNIRKVTTSTGIITTVAGGGSGCAGSDPQGDGCPATSVALNAPSSVAVDSAGDIYISDYYGIRRVDAVTGLISTMTTPGVGPVSDIALDAIGNLYLTDASNSMIWSVTPSTGNITAVAGSGAAGYNTIALNGPMGVAVDSLGNLYIADTGNQFIRKKDVSDAPSLSYATPTLVGTMDEQDGLPPTVTVENIGNEPLTISQISVAPDFFTTSPPNFPLGSDTTCSTSSQTLAPASTCAFAIVFLPTVGDSLSESMVLTDNTLNASAATQTIGLQGTGVSQAITFANPGAQTYGIPLTLTATASSGLTVSYAVTGPATLSGSTLTFNGVGSVTVTASQTGNGTTYGAATPVPQTFAVGPAALTVAANSTTVLFGAPIPALSGTLTGVVTGDIITASYATSAVQGSPAGSYAITATLNDPNSRLSNYNVTNTPGLLTITPVGLNLPPSPFGSVSVGAATGSLQTLSFTVPAGITLGGVSAVTQGAPNRDFTVVPGGTTCASGTTATTCTVQVQFLPTTPGTRLGGVVLSDSSGNTLTTVLLQGTGTGPRVAFGPGTISTVAGNGTGCPIPGAPITECYNYNGDGGAATNAALGYVWSTAVDGAGNLYIADASNNRIRKVTASTGEITTVAGTGSAGYNGDNIAATSAELYFPWGVAVDGAGSLYIADSGNNRIRKVTPDGTIHTVAGSGPCTSQLVGGCFSGDGGLATSAMFAYASFVAVDGVGNLFITDLNNDRIRMVTPAGTINTVAGDGTIGYSGDGKSATGAELSLPYGIAVDGAGNLYIADYGNRVVRMVTPGANGIISTVAGNGSCAIIGAFNECYSGDGTQAVSAELDAPLGVAVDGFGNLYIADMGNIRVREVTAATGMISTVAGTGAIGFSGDGGPATSANLSEVSNVAVDGAGNLYIVDQFNYRIRKVDVSDAPSLTFASTNTGQASVMQDVTVLNFGNAPLAISPINTSANFSLGVPDTTCSSSSQTLLPSASCVLGVEFNPTAGGSLTGGVVLTDNTLNSTSATQTIALQGTGAATGMATQTITFANPGTQVYGTPPLTLTAMASSGLAVSYTVTGPATLSGSPLSILTFTGAGSVTVTASQAGNGTYGAATPVPQTFSVKQTALTVVPNPASVLYGAPIPALTGTLTGVVTGDIITASYATNAVQGSPAGSYTITATLNDPNNRLSNYDVANIPGTLTIMPVGLNLPPSPFASVSVGATTGSLQTLSFTVPAGITLGGVSAVTQGAPNRDFTVVPGGTTCASGTTATTCAVQLKFLPTAVGSRFGAVVFTDQSTPPNTLLTVPLSGVGTGPVVAFAPGTITTDGPATATVFNVPSGVAFDGAGNLYITDGSNRIFMLTPGGTISTVAGNGTWGYSGNGSPAISAELEGPAGVVVDGAGNLYFSDFGNNVIRQITPAGIISTVAGNGTWGYGGDGGPATSAELEGPTGIAVDGAGNLYIADASNNRIRKVTPGQGWTITTVAGGGSGGDGGPATSAALASPEGVAVDGAGNLYIADSGHGVIREVTPGGIISTVPLNNAKWPVGVALDGAGNLYISDPTAGLIRMVAPSGFVTTVAGNGSCAIVDGYGTCYSGDNGPATGAELSNPSYIALDGAGNLYIADSSNYCIRKVDVSEPPSLTFASINVGQASTAQDVTVLNLGNAPLTISPINTSANFSLGDSDTTCGSSSQTLAAAASCVLGIEFIPTTGTSISGSVVLTDNTLNATLATQTIALQGTGIGGAPAISLSATSLAFGNALVSTPQIVANVTAAQTVTLTNTGTGPLTITNIALTGTNNAAFVTSNDCPSSLAANGGNCAIRIRFYPQAVGTASAALTITDNAAGSTQSIALSGTGTNAAVSLSTTSLAFGSQLLANATAAQTVTLTNTGTGPLAITSIVPTGTNSASFVVTSNTCPASPLSLGVGANCSIGVAFNPQAVGAASAALTITDNAVASPQSVLLSGTGTNAVASLSATSLAFGNAFVSTPQTVANVTAAQTVLLTNTGTGPLTITNIALTGTNNAAFLTSNDCPSSLAANGGNCAIRIRFYPQAVGTASAALTITDNAAGSTQSIALSGTGTNAAVSLSTTSLAFGSQLLANATAAQTVTLTNTGTGPLTITSIVPTGTNSASFVVTSNTCPASPSSLGMGANCSIGVAFDPQAVGAASAALTITDNAVASPQSVSLSGTGTNAVASLSATSLAFGNALVSTPQTVANATAAQTVTLTNTGAGPLTITNIALTGMNNAAFVTSNNCPSSLAANGGNCAIRIRFYPQATGPASAALTITDNAVASPQSIALTGTGQ